MIEEQGITSNKTKNTDSEIIKEKENYFSFRKMFSPMLIKIIYVIGMVVIVVSALGMLKIGAEMRGSVKDELLLSGIALLLFGNILWRIICEGWIVLFSMHEAMVAIHKTIKEK